MKIVMVEKNKLSSLQLRLIEDRLSLPEHINDLGPSQVWRTYSSGLFAFFCIETDRLIGLAEASGVNNVQPGWWIDTVFREQGYGNHMVDLLAENLKQRGVTRIGRMLITTHQQQYDQQSTRLAQRMRRHFERVYI
ncbi:MAG TPA: hypothetical protein PLF22_08520 [Pseudomonadales bacterium]|nr:hypothetical protein [Pseudomonadales bacterium]